MIWNIITGICVFILICVLCCYQNLGRTDVNLDDKSIEITKLPSEREAYI